MLKNLFSLPIILVAFLLTTGCVENKSTEPPPPPEPTEEDLAIQATFDYIDQNYPHMLEYPNDIRVKLAAQDRLGGWHIRLDQYYKDLKVLYSQSIAHLAPDLTMHWFDQHFINDLDVNTNPKVALTMAVDIAVEHQQAIGGNGEIMENGQLLLYPKENVYRLSWLFYMKSATTLENWEYIVSAEDGEILYYWDQIIY